MKVQIGIGCHDKEAYWPHAKAVVDSYRGIRASPFLVYNGHVPNLSAEIRLKDSGEKVENSIVGVNHAHEYVLKSGVPRWISLCVDSWLLDDSAIIRIFDRMESDRCCFAGNYWHTTDTLSGDIMFLDLRYGDPFDNGFKYNGRCIESSIYDAVTRVGKFHIIREREPVHWKNRFECTPLKWVMYHTLEENLKRRKELVGW